MKKQFLIDALIVFTVVAVVLIALLAIYGIPPMGGPD
jgi:hypothetical protein